MYLNCITKYRETEPDYRNWLSRLSVCSYIDDYIREYLLTPEGIKQFSASLVDNTLDNAMYEVRETVLRRKYAAAMEIERADDSAIEGVD